MAEDKSILDEAWDAGKPQRTTGRLPALQYILLAIAGISAFGLTALFLLREADLRSLRWFGLPIPGPNAFLIVIFAIGGGWLGTRLCFWWKGGAWFRLIWVGGLTGLSAQLIIQTTGYILRPWQEIWGEIPWNAVVNALGGSAIQGSIWVVSLAAERSFSKPIERLPVAVAALLLAWCIFEQAPLRGLW